MNTISDKGYFGKYGGMFAPETLMPTLDEVARAYRNFRKDHAMMQRYTDLLKNYVGRETPLYFASGLSCYLKGARIYLKREDLNHTGAHKINNALGQALLAVYMGKTRLIAETGAGQHGVATATAAALLGLQCDIFMGVVDMDRQRPNVFRMKLLGANVIPVESGGKTLKDAVNEALRNWTSTVRDTHYVFGSALGPYPFPDIVRDFQSVIGKETRKQILDQAGKLPDNIIACVGGGSNSIGIFNEFLEDTSVKLTGVEAGGEGLVSRKHSIRLTKSDDARPGILHGAYSYVLQNSDGQIANTHSISAGLDYSGVGPQHSFLFDNGRVDYTFATDDEAVNAFRLLCEKEGIIPALESSHAIAHAIKESPRMSPESIIIINLSGRGDKDIYSVANYLGNTI